MLPIAHAGHWIESILYCIPLVVLIGFVVVAKVKDRRAEKAELAAGGGEDPAAAT